MCPWLSPFLLLGLAYINRPSALLRSPHRSTLSAQNRTYFSSHSYLKFSPIMDLSIGNAVTAIGMVHEYGVQLETSFPGILVALENADRNRIDEEDYARQVLNSVKNTPEFLDDVTKLVGGGLDVMLLEFMSGKSAEEVTRKGFKMPLSSATKQHFDEIAVKLDVRSWLIHL